jgi:sulfite exporter TauE/SafE
MLLHAVTIPTDPGLVVLVAVGLFGSAHCLGMCGPLVTLYADRCGADGPTSWFEIRQHLLFNAGRTASYATIGALLGALGGTVFEAAALTGVATPIRAVAGITIGLVVVAVGIRYLAGGAIGHGVDLPLVGDAVGRVQSVVSERAERWVRGPRIALLGAVHGVLPCPLLYPVFLYAFATGSALRGALSLAALGAGTVPLVFAYGLAVGRVGPTGRERLHRALGVAFVGLGWIPLGRGLALAGVDPLATVL